MQIGNAQPILADDDEDQTQIENSFLNNHNRLNDENAFADFYYYRKQFNPDDIQLTKRIIMLPRVGRRSIR